MGNADPPRNLLLILTDQERAVQHFPPGWSERNQPSLQRLKRHGLAFERAFCNTCMCSPSRSTLFTGLYAAQHSVTDTLTFAGRFSPTETVLDPSLPNLANVLRAAGYSVHYRGKWHLSKGETEDSLTAADVAVYGFQGWQPPDAGEDTKIQNFGGGFADHDAEYIRQAAAFLADPPPGPWCLVLSLVNPHDVLSYPETYTFGYSQADLEGDVELPATLGEDLSTKPTAQQLLVESAFFGLGPLVTPERRRAYVNFYANLVSQIDRQLAPLVDLLYGRDGKPTALAESTLVVRTADHGEMGLAHGGLRQKAFNVYEETLRVPLVFSNPVLFPEARSTESLAGLIDLVPTFVELLLGAEAWDGWRRKLSGRSLVPILRDPSAEVQREIVFTFDDVRASINDRPEAVAAANRIRCVRTRDWKYARYFHADGSFPEQHEMYDLSTDAQAELEVDNLAHPGSPRYREVAEERERLARLLAEKEHTIVQKHQNLPDGG